MLSASKIPERQKNYNVMQGNKSKAEKHKVSLWPKYTNISENFIERKFKIIKMCRHAVFIEGSLLFSGLRH